MFLVEIVMKNGETSAKIVHGSIQVILNRARKLANLKDVSELYVSTIGPFSRMVFAHGG